MNKDPYWLHIAAKEIGNHKIMGINENSHLLKYSTATTIKTTEDEIKWNSDFINWCFLQVSREGFDCLGTESSMARSWLRWGKSLRTPYHGCVVVLNRGSKIWQGHVGFYINSPSIPDDSIAVFGANVKNRVGLWNYKKDAILGFREPNIGFIQKPGYVYKN